MERITKWRNNLGQPGLLNKICFPSVAPRSVWCILPNEDDVESKSGAQARYNCHRTKKVRQHCLMSRTSSAAWNSCCLLYLACATAEKGRECFPCPWWQDKKEGRSQSEVRWWLRLTDVEWGKGELGEHKLRGAVSYLKVFSHAGQCSGWDIPMCKISLPTLPAYGMLISASERLI